MASYKLMSGMFLPLAILAALLSTGYTQPAHAQLSALADPTGEDQCEGADINDYAVVVGRCSPKNANGSTLAFMNYAGTTTVLPALSAGQDCSADGVNDEEIIIGSCESVNGNDFATTWNADSPSTPPLKLAPLPVLLGLLADVSTAPTGYNQAGVVIGESINSTEVSTAVLWPKGSGTPTEVSTLGDNCEAVDANDSSATAPAVLLNCPNTNGTVTAKLAQATGLLGAYVATALPIPSGSTYCSVSGINNALQIIGTCHTAAPDTPTAAYWSTPTSTPMQLTVVVGSVNARTEGSFINSSGHVVFHYQTGVGVENAGFWIPGSNVKLIPPLSGGIRVAAIGLGDDDLVSLTSEDSTENTQAATWTPAGGTQAEGFVNGGQSSAATAINKSGTAIAGIGEGTSENDNAVEDTSL